MPIHRAALDGDLHALNQELQLDSGLLNVRVNLVDVEDPKPYPTYLRSCTPLELAAGAGHNTVVARLLELGANNYHATHRACHFNRVSTLTLLLDAGAPLNDRTERDYTPLMAAAAAPSGAIDCVALLLARGGSGDGNSGGSSNALELNAQSKNGGTAIYCAAACGHTAVVQLLIDAGADPTITGCSSRTIAHVVAQINGHEECADLLWASITDAKIAYNYLKARYCIDAAQGGAGGGAGPLEESCGLGEAAAALDRQRRRGERGASRVRQVRSRVGGRRRCAWRGRAGAAGNAAGGV